MHWNSRVVSKHLLKCVLFFVTVGLMWERISFAAEEVRQLYVNPTLGDDAADGLSAAKEGASGPVKTLERVVRMAGPGDTINLAKAVYNESFDLTGKHGEPGKPYVIDGHGATLNGERLIELQDWKEVGSGLYRNTKLWEMPLRKQKDWVLRWFMIFDGKVNRMGRCMKGENAPYKNPSDLLPGEWTYQENDEHAFFIKVDPKKSLAEARVGIPWEVNGVSVHGANHDMIIRNITAMRVINDGYNITPVPSGARIYDVRFENITAIECGDDGFSAHDDCTLTIDGFYSTLNGTGLCTAGNAINNRLHLVNNVGWELYFYESPTPGVFTQVVKNSLIDCHADNAFLAVGGRKPDDRCFVKLENVLIKAPASGPLRTRRAMIRDRAHVEAKSLTTEGLSFDIGGLGMSLQNSVIKGGSAVTVDILPKTEWSADHNIYDLASINLAGHTYLSKQFADYQRETKQDGASTVRELKGNERAVLQDNPVGADPQQIPSTTDIKP